MIDDIDMKIIEYLEKGFNQKEIAQMIFVSQSSVSQRIKKMELSGIKLERNKRLDEIDYMIIELLKDGVKQKEIARRLGITEYNVTIRIKKIKEFGFDIDKLKCETLDKKIIKSTEEGLTHKEIANTLGIDKSVIVYRVNSMNKKGMNVTKRDKIIPVIEKRRESEEREKLENLSDIDKRIIMYLDEGMSILEITRITNAPRQFISIEIRKMRENGIRLPEYDKAREVFILLKEGLSYKEISKELHASTKTISTIVKKKLEEYEENDKDLSDLNNKLNESINSKIELETVVSKYEKLLKGEKEEKEI